MKKRRVLTALSEHAEVTRRMAELAMEAQTPSDDFERLRDRAIALEEDVQDELYHIRWGDAEGAV